MRRRFAGLRSAAGTALPRAPDDALLLRVYAAVFFRFDLSGILHFARLCSGVPAPGRRNRTIQPLAEARRQDCGRGLAARSRGRGRRSDFRLEPAGGRRHRFESEQQSGRLYAVAGAHARSDARIVRLSAETPLARRRRIGDRLAGGPAPAGPSILGRSHVDDDRARPRRAVGDGRFRPVLVVAGRLPLPISQRRPAS